MQRQQGKPMPHMVSELSSIYSRVIRRRKKKKAAQSSTNSCETVSLEGRLWQWHKQSKQSLSIFVQVDRGSTLGPLVMLAPRIALPDPKQPSNSKACWC